MTLQESSSLIPSTIERMRIPLFHVDAFTDEPFRGNPAAVCLLDSCLDDPKLLKVTAENNLSETAFLVTQGEGYDLRWFTPKCEVRLCGHATLASAYVLLNLLHPDRHSVRLTTRYSGTLTVQRQGEYLLMDLPTKIPHPCPVPEGLARALGDPPLVDTLTVDDVYYVVLESPDAVRNVRPDFALLEQLHPFTVTITAPGTDEDFVSRYFAPSYGVPEDPVTGSSHCALAPYWTNRLGKSQLHARQFSQRGGELWCEVAGDRVLLKGKAVLTLQGSLML